MKNQNCLLYYRILKALFPSTSFREAKFLLDVKKQLIEYSLLHPNSSYDDITDFFGKPEDILVDYINSFGSANLYQKIRKKNTLRLVLTILVLIALITWIIIFAFWYKSYYDFSNSMPVYNETNIDKGEFSNETN